jgi:hypothetical protein
MVGLTGSWDQAEEQMQRNIYIEAVPFTIQKLIHNTVETYEMLVDS